MDVEREVIDLTGHEEEFWEKEFAKKGKLDAWNETKEEFMADINTNCENEELCVPCAKLRGKEDYAQVLQRRYAWTADDTPAVCEERVDWLQEAALHCMEVNGIDFGDGGTRECLEYLESYFD